MLRQVSFKNIGVLRDVTLELGPLTVLVGPNGSGKSSILRGIHALLEVAPQELRRTLRGTPESQEMVLVHMLDRGGELRGLVSSCGLVPHAALFSVGSLNTRLACVPFPVLQRITWDLSQFVGPCRLVRESISSRCGVEFLSTEHGPIPLDDVGDGLLRILGLLLVLHDHEEPCLLFLDNLERGLHLDGQSKIIALLREHLKRCPDMQVVCSTHSPHMLNAFDVSEIRVLGLDASRAAHAARLDSHPEFEKWRFGFQAGELWAALGSDWVAQAQEGVGPR